MIRNLLALATGLAFAGATWADKPSVAATKGASAVVTAAIVATGGEELLNKFKGTSMTMKGEMSMMGLDLEFEGKVIAMQPDKYKMTIDTSLMGQKLSIEQVMNGKKMKASLNGMAIPLDDDTKDQLQDSITEMEITQLTPLLDAKKYTLKSGDEAEVDGKKADVVIVNSENGKVKDMKLFFDKTSHLLVKTQKKDKDESDKEIDEESFYLDYKKVQGVLTPHKGSVKHDGKDFMKFTLSDVKLLEKVDDKEFAIDD